MSAFVAKSKPVNRPPIENKKPLPNIVLAEFISQYELSASISEHQLEQAVKRSMIFVNNQLLDFVANNLKITSDQFFLYKDAVFNLARSFLANDFRHLSATNDGGNSAEIIEAKIKDYKIASLESIRLFLNKPKNVIKLI